MAGLGLTIYFGIRKVRRRNTGTAPSVTSNEDEAPDRMKPINLSGRSSGERNEGLGELEKELESGTRSEDLAHGQSPSSH